jgi:SNF2 family DNA or RNA helicase
MTRGKFLDRYAVRNEWNSVVGYVNVDEVRDTIKPFFLRRLKKDVAKQLPEKIFKNVYVELSTEERKIYKAIKDQSHEITEESQAITVVLRARQFCNAPGLVDEYPEFGAKYEACMELLEEIISNGHKVLIFSMFEKMVEMLYVAFEKHGWKCMKITGDTKKKDRPAIARKFNEDPNIDICVMDEAGSTGLNFQEASYVLHYDDNWSPAIMKQRTDRAHRITTDHTVTVVNFICLNTIEDHVRETLKKKDSLSADAIGDDVNDVCAIKTLSGKEAMKLL